MFKKYYLLFLVLALSALPYLKSLENNFVFFDDTFLLLQNPLVQNFDFNKVLDFDGYADRFIFDARGDAPGGNGVRFDWNKMKEYDGATPFLLAGGIGYNHIDEIKYFDHPACIGIDINSKFERAPGDKDLITIKKFVHELRN